MKEKKTNYIQYYVNQAVLFLFQYFAVKTIFLLKITVFAKMFFANNYLFDYYSTYVIKINYGVFQPAGMFSCR